MELLCFYVPVESAQKVKEALFSAGAGRIGNYDQCAWEVRGVGQFRPLEGSNPAIGNLGVAEKVEEMKVEMICQEALKEVLIQALRRSHPYEEPVYYFLKV